MSTSQLTTTQHAVLTHAVEHGGGRIDWFPKTVKGGACTKVVTGLANRGLAIQADGAWHVTPAAYAALGRDAPTPVAPRRIRENTKQATVIAMLRRPEGATIAQMASALEWQSHTVRGALAGALKKKLGLTLVSEKTEGQERVYRIVDQAA